MLASAVCGAIGTGLLYRGSFALEAPAAFADDAFIADMVARNKKRQRLQRAGLSLLMLSFLLGGASLFFE